MAVYYKPQSPIQSGEDFIYPITTADQIMKSDKSRRLEQAGLIMADNSTSLGGVAAKDYALKTDTAPDSAKLGGKAPEYYTNPRNLLDNSDFRNPVNQRGATTAENSFIVDRWYTFNDSQSGGAALTSSGITLSGNGYLQQRLSKGILQTSKPYTLAVYYSDSTVDVGTNGDIIFVNGDFDLVNNVYANGKTISHVALYEGSYTADTLPPYVPKGYAAELAACNSAPVDLGGGYGGGSLQAYPVGSIYMSVNSTSPASLFGGTWEILNDVFLLAAGSYANAGTFGGEAAHALTVNEMPVHHHSLGHTGDHSSFSVTWGNIYANVEIPSAIAVTHTPGEGLAGNSLVVFQSEDHITATSGGGAAHNNLPPYMAVYMWKRVS